MRPAATPYNAVLVPALLKIQHEHGYLDRNALVRFSEESGVPLYRMQAVASFFPHFRLTPPPKVVIRVCRDMACRMNGSGQTLRELGAAANADIGVAGVSCLGRCDRPMAACMTINGSEHDLLYLGRTTAQLREIAQAAAAGNPPKSDHDADLPYTGNDWLINSYPNRPAEYTAITKAVQLRDASINASVEYLRGTGKFSADQLDRFRAACIGQLRVEFEVDPPVEQAVRDWQCATGWAKGPQYGDWADALIKEIGDADLRGMGGAGIPATQKWKDVRDAIRQARKRDEDDRGFIVVNGDESEPATFKDRELLLRTPHTIIEGVILAGLITEATQGFIYIRHEYHEQIEACDKEIARAASLGFCGPKASLLGRPFYMATFTSPGGYICGEQSALIEAMSDHRGEPRNMPPKLETNGLIDLPTLVSNVETYAWVPYIVNKGGKDYASHGVNAQKGQRFFSISGDVKRPGVYEVPMGMTLKELIYGEKYCQGIANGRKLKAFAPSGPSGGFLPARLTAKAGLPRKFNENKTWLAIAERRGFDPAATDLDLCDLELELNIFRGLSPTQALGAGLVVYDDSRNMMEEALNSLEFYRNESCGKCVPCRLGSQKMVSLATHIVNRQVSSARWKDELGPLMKELGRAIELASICGLGRSVPVPLRTVADYFPEDLAKYLA